MKVYGLYLIRSSSQTGEVAGNAALSVLAMDDTASIAPTTTRREAQAFRSRVKADRSVWSQNGEAHTAPVRPTRGIISD